MPESLTNQGQQDDSLENNEGEYGTALAAWILKADNQKLAAGIEVWVVSKKGHEQRMVLKKGHEQRILLLNMRGRRC